MNIRPVDVACTVAKDDILRYLTQLGSVGRRLRTADPRIRPQVDLALRTAYQEFIVNDDVRYTAGAGSSMPVANAPAAS